MAPVLRLKKRLTGLVFALLCISSVACGRAERPQAKAGVLDLRNYDYSISGPARLDGEWEFYWKQLLIPSDFSRAAGPASVVEPDGYFTAPGVWNDLTLRDGSKIESGDGFATLRLRVHTPPEQGGVLALRMPIVSTAARVWINGELLLSAGAVSSAATDGRPENRPALIAFPAPQNPEDAVEILIQLSNYHIYKGGLRVSLAMGPQAEVIKLDRRQLGIDLFLFGSLFIMGIYHFGLYILRREDRSLLYFALFSLLIAIRTLITGERFVSLVAPGLFSWDLETRLDFITISLAPLLFILFIRSLYPEEVAQYIVRSVQITSGLGLALVLFFPARIYAGPVQALLILYLLIGIYVLFRLIVAAYRGREGVGYFLAGFLALVLTFANDVLYSYEVINSARIIPLGLFLFIFSQSVLLSIKFANAFRRIERMSDSMTRFVPQRFLQLLGRERIEDVRLGDQVEREMTVLFSDLRDFTRLSETMSPAENFAFLNGLLRQLGPLIREHGGFIDKYIGDAIMALFPGEPEDALRAAVRMTQELSNYNVARVAGGAAPISMGVGVHTGRLMLGTIGEEERIEGTVISDAVNLAARLEGLTKTYGAQILISEATLFRLPDPSRYGLRMLGRAQVKGKNEPVVIFEAFDGDAPERVAMKSATRAKFEKGVQALFSGEYDEARTRFDAVLATNPEDVAARHYLDVITARLASRAAASVEPMAGDASEPEV